MRLVLASASPRRRELLAGAGLTFEVRPADVDESIAPTTEPVAAALEIAARKWGATAAGLEPGEFGLVADTVVGLEVAGRWQLFAKPDGPEDAAAMLRALSNSRHLVATGVAVGAPGVPTVSGVARTWVRMRAIAPAEIADYVASGEWRGKAGGYAIQESADRFVVELEGDGMDNVVGLPVRLALSLLEQVGYTPARAALERYTSIGGGRGAR